MQPTLIESLSRHVGPAAAADARQRGEATAIHWRSEGRRVRTGAAAVGLYRDLREGGWHPLYAEADTLPIAGDAP